VFGDDHPVLAGCQIPENSNEILRQHNDVMTVTRSSQPCLQARSRDFRSATFSDNPL